jgi:hypothetical protein
MEAVKAALLKAKATVHAMLQEIFDESAYQRFLDRKQLQASSRAYSMFTQENEQAKSRRPRCC